MSLLKLDGFPLVPPVLHWSLPGHGQAHADCGTVRWRGCRRHDKAYVKLCRRSCGRPECPVCYEKWASREAHRATARLAEYRGRHRKPIHVVVSPDKSLVDALTYPKLRRAAYRALKAAGIVGGLLIYHPWREDEDGKGKKNGHWRYSPHFHSVCYGWIPPDAYQRTGWVVKNLGIRNSVYSTVMYQLSHAGVSMEQRGGILPVGQSMRFQTVVWFGACSYNKLKVPRAERRFEFCPVCGDTVYDLVWVGVGKPPSGRDGDEFYLDPGDWIALEGGSS